MATVIAIPEALGLAAAELVAVLGLTAAVGAPQAQSTSASATAVVVSRFAFLHPRCCSDGCGLSDIQTILEALDRADNVEHGGLAKGYSAAHGGGQL